MGDKWESGGKGGLKFIGHLILKYRASQIYYMRLGTAVAHSLGWLARRLAGRHTDAVPKHSLLFQFSFRIIGHVH